MYKYFDSKFFTRNREALRKLCKHDAPIVIAANGRMQKSADIPFPFHQDSNFWYLSGINEPEAILVIDVQETYIILPDMSDYLNYFYGQMKNGGIEKISGIKQIYGSKEGWEKLTARVKKAKQVYSLTPPPDYLEVYGMHANPSRRELVEKINNLVPKTTIIDVRQKLALMRMVKQPSEIKALQAAVDLTVRAFSDISKRSFKTEKEIEAAFSIYFLEHEQRFHGYDPIVAAGNNACLMHYNDNQTQLSSNDLILIDIGAEFDGYSADITRVFSTARPTKRQLEVHAAVEAVQAFAIKQTKPGVTIRENEKMIEEFMGEQLIKLGVIKKADRKTIRHYYPHAASHYLGRDIHDLGDYDTPLASNMVLTIEPGIYIPEEGIGIRIEDDVIVTENGCRIMSDKLPGKLI